MNATAGAMATPRSLADTRGIPRGAIIDSENRQLSYGPFRYLRILCAAPYIVAGLLWRIKLLLQVSLSEVFGGWETWRLLQMLIYLAAFPSVSAPKEVTFSSV